ncbi:hypothetical protein ACQKWADRAFT_289957 [Trichoderma austrokoningii]
MRDVCSRSITFDAIYHVKMPSVTNNRSTVGRFDAYSRQLAKVRRLCMLACLYYLMSKTDFDNHQRWLLA